MSKFKLLYDVVNTMKDKEVIQGAFTATGTKDQNKFLSFVNEFEKNLSSGETKVKISSEVNCEGKTVKHESQTEFNLQGCCGGHRHHGFMKHMHHRHHHGNPCEQTQDPKCGGFKGKLSKLAFVLDIIKQIKVEENEDKSVILALNLTEIPAELQKVCQARMSQGAIPEHHQHHQGFMKEFLALKDSKIDLKVWINPANEIEKIMLTADGSQIDEQNVNHEVNLLVELRLA